MQKGSQAKGNKPSLLIIVNGFLIKHVGHALGFFL